VLAFEVTRITHGEAEARKAQTAARALFAGGGDDDAAPTTALPRATLEAGVPLVDLLVAAGLCASRSEARRVIAQGGAYLNGRPATGPDQAVTTVDLQDGGQALLRVGKKRYHRIVAE
jgi:tyrosyl-tRNA synthetase